MTKDIAKNLIDTYKEVQKDPPLRASFSWNILRKVIEDGQEKETEVKRRAKSKAVKKEKGYKFKDELFPKKLKIEDRQRYIEEALKYILRQNINILDSSVEKER